MICLKNVTKTYGKTGKTAVKDLTWDIADGEITGFIGPNGAGKSTTLKMITGITEATKGEITLNGKNILHEPVETKKIFGFVSDTPDNFLRLRAIEYLNFIADVYGVSKEERKQRISEMAERFQIANALEDKIASFSHGMRQKTMIMGALLHKPAIWILDEPMTGLDPEASFTLKEMMREHAKEGNSVLFSTHVLEVAERLCDKIGMIADGRLVFSGTLEELKAKYPEEDSLEEIFLKVTRHA